MTKRERIAAAIAGQPVDRVPYSLWYHFLVEAGRLPAGPEMVAAELDFYHKYDPDLFKVMHDIPYEMPASKPQVQSVEDWARLPALDGVSGNFGKQLEAIRQIMAGRGDDGPTVDTIFGVFATAEKVCGRRTLEFLRQAPEAVHVGLANIARSLSNYARALIASGANGIYLAISGAAADTMSAEEYKQHFLAYDQQVLDAAAGGTANVAHHHGVGIYPDLVLGLRGFQIYSWSNRLQGNPSLREMRVKTTTCLMGGVNEVNFGEVTPDDIIRQVKETIAETSGHGVIVGPGCAVPTPPDSTEENLRAFRAGVQS
jgi:uroporphyrinogen decarboxylase